MTSDSSHPEDIISLPQGGGAIKGLGESFSPDLHTGTGNFTVPVDVPTGRRDLQPDLELTYSTGTGNGQFGSGWNLNLSGITRKTDDGIPRYRDGASDTAEWDTFLLPGVEGLVPVAVWEYDDQDRLVKTDSPTDNAFADAPVVQFKPRTESSFARIRYHRDGQNDYWEVESANGQVNYYGTPAPDDADPTWQDPAVIADPNNTDNVFAWKLTETRDPFGNRIVYEYERDTSTETPSEHHHEWEQLYPKRIRYAEYDDAESEFLVSINFEYENRPDSHSDYRAGFEIRTRKRCTKITIKTHAGEPSRLKTYDLTYLDQRTDISNLDERLPPNGMSLLSQIQIVGHDGPDEEQLPPLEFNYTTFQPSEREFSAVDGADLPDGLFSSSDLELTDLSGNGLPDLVEIDDTVRYWRNKGGGEFDRPRSMQRSPAGLTLADPDVQLLDATGDGRADLMTDREGLAGYFPLTFDGTWSDKSFQGYDQAPSFDLQDPDVKLVDLDGDGVTDAVRSGSRFECYFNDPERGWTETRRVHRGAPESFPDVDFSDPRVRWADMTGDGQQDIVLVYDGSVAYWPNLGYGDWGPRVHMDGGPRFEYGYDPQRVLVGDVDGDGAADIVYVDDDRVKLWMNQSGSSWSDPIEVDGTPPVMDQSNVRLIDLHGTGVAGVAWSGHTGGTTQERDTDFFLDFTGGTKPYLLNEMDNNLGAVTRVEYAPSTEYLLNDQRAEQPANRSQLPFPVQVVARVESIDQISGSKHTTEYNYHHGHWDGTEREFRGFGMVEQYDTETFIDYNTPGLHGEDITFARVDDPEQFSPPTLTKTWFHQGPVDVEEGGWQTLDYSEEYWDGDDQLLGDAEHLQSYLSDGDVPSHAKRDTLRSLRGRILREEYYGLDGTDVENRPYSVIERRPDVRVEHMPDSDNGDQRRVFFPHTVAERTTEWERGEDPRTTIQFTDNYDDHGQPREQTHVALPRREAKRTGLDVVERGRMSGDELNDTQVKAIHTRTEYADPQGDSYIHDRVAQERTLKLSNPPTVTERKPDDLAVVLQDQVTAARQVRQRFTNELDTWQATQLLPSAVQLIDHELNHYDGDAFEGLPPGQVGDYGALTRTESLAFQANHLDDIYGDRRPTYLGGSAGLPAGAPSGFGQDLGYHHHQTTDSEYHAGYYIDTIRRRYDTQDTAAATDWGLITATENALKDRTRIEPDQYGLLPQRVIDPAGLVRDVEYDYRVFEPKQVTDPNGKRTHIRYTPLGNVEKRFVTDENGNGGTAQRPEVRYEYNHRAYQQTRDREQPQPAYVHTVRREQHASESNADATIESREYSDGFGRVIQQRSQAPELAFSEQSDGIGLPQEPDASPAPAVGDRDENRVVVSGWTVYDNKGRVVEKYEPFFDSGWTYQPEAEAQQGKHTTQYYDPRGRLTRLVNPDGSEQRQIFGIPETVSDPDQYEPTPWEGYTYDANDNAGRTHPSNADLDASHHNTPTHEIQDALGRTIGTIEWTRGSGQSPGQPIERLLTQSRYDIRGNLIETIDPRGRSAYRGTYDLLGNELSSYSLDAGVGTRVLDAAGNPVETRDGKGSVVLQEYDELQRPTRLWARDDDSSGQVTLRDQRVYGDDAAVDASTAQAGNLLGRLYEHYDGAGLRRVDAYDFKGNVTKKTRRVVSDQALSGGWTADWAAANPEADLEASGYTTEITYDALNRPIELRYPSDVNGSRVTLTPTYDRGGGLTGIDLDGTSYVDQIAYNARGERTLIAYGNGLLTRYSYDSTTFRLARVRTEPSQTTTNSDTWTGAGAALQDTTYTYDLVGNIVQSEETAPDTGIAGENPDKLTREFEYDARYRLTKATGREHDFAGPKPEPWADRRGHSDPTQTRRYERHYSYDPTDNIERLRHVAGGEGFTRRFEQASGSNQLDQLTVDDGTTTEYDYDYDDSGNLLEETSARTFGWDHANRLRTFQQAGSQSTEVQYLYDGTGQRVKKLVENGSEMQSTTYIDGLFERHRWQRGDSAGEYDRLHVKDNRKRIAVVRRASAPPGDSKPSVQYHFADHLGSSTVVADGSGQAVNREEYFPYGETSFGGFATKQYRFTGKERDDASGLSCIGARYYAPWLAGWTSPDPAGIVTGANQYVYALNQPVRFVDPTGYASEDTGSGVLQKITSSKWWKEMYVAAELSRALGGAGEENFHLRGPPKSEPKQQLEQKLDDTKKLESKGSSGSSGSSGSPEPQKQPTVHDQVRRSELRNKVEQGATRQRRMNQLEDVERTISEREKQRVLSGEVRAKEKGWLSGSKGKAASSNRTGQKVAGQIAEGGKLAKAAKGARFVPVLGTVVGLGFAAKEAYAGNYGRAGLELAGASEIPYLAQAADAALLASDIHSAATSDGSSSKPESGPEPKSQSSSGGGAGGGGGGSGGEGTSSESGSGSETREVSFEPMDIHVNRPVDD